MPKIIEAENLINSYGEAPDKLRAELGSFINSGLETQSFSTNKIDKHHIPVQSTLNDQVLIPIKKQKIFLGADRSFRDFSQWENFLLDTIKTSETFQDHTCNIAEPEVFNSMIKGEHVPSYENASKSIDSNELINYNLFSYRHKEDLDNLKNIAEIRTRFDRGGTLTLGTIFDQIENRLENFTGSVADIVEKQRNIFKLLSTNDIDTTISLESFPCHLKKEITSPQMASNSFLDNLKNFKKEKNLFQSIKNDQLATGKNFSLGGSNIGVKLHDVNAICTTRNFSTFSENFDETFLLEETDLHHSSDSERFVNQINSVKFLKALRDFVADNRSIQEIYTLADCDTFVLGYKIEKYLDRELGNPIQTYFTNSNKLEDTQLKYGREYFYKTKILLGVLGSSYSYSNLVFSRSENEMVDSSDEIVTSHPAEYEEVSSYKYTAYLDVDILPSFQILEFEIEPVENPLRKVAFIDSPSPIPYVDFFGCMSKPTINFRLMPRFFSYYDPASITTQGNPAETVDFTKQQEITKVGTLRPSDQEIARLYEISGEKRMNSDYFYGDYEVYRMEHPPASKYEFANYYLGSFNTTQDVWRPNGISHDSVGIKSSVFSDRIIPNRKYYYAFRSITFHGTPSELSNVYEVELLKDSDEYKVVASLYNIDERASNVFKKPFKRIMRLIPNEDRLQLNSEATDVASLNFGDADTDPAHRLFDLTSPDTREFKIRVTSKHTGKKIDINIVTKVNKTGF